MMMKKGIAALMIATTLCLGVGEAKAAIGLDFLAAPQPTPVADGVSIAPLGIISMGQTMIKTYSATEEALQNVLKNAHTSVDLGIFEVELGLSKEMKKMAKGVLDMPDDMAREHTGMSAKKLAKVTQDALTTSAGTIEAIAQYEKERDYEEQRRIIDQVASALLIKNGLKTMGEAVDSFAQTYDSKFSGERDYNQALRDNASIRLLYDQLLSLQQQILAQRLQAKGDTQKSFVMTIAQSLSKD